MVLLFSKVSHFNGKICDYIYFSLRVFPLIAPLFGVYTISDGVKISIKNFFRKI